MGKRIGLIAAAVVLCLWLTAGIIDFSRVHCFERPIFCVLSEEASFDDGGSGTYIGLGYSFDIKGNFMPEDELPGVTQYTAKLFGISVMEGIRD